MSTKPKQLGLTSKGVAAATHPPGDLGRPPTRPDPGHDRERAAYLLRRPGLLKEAEGRFVAFVGEEMRGPFETFREAFLDARRAFGPGPLYIKQIRHDEPVFEPIAIEPCPH